MKLQDEDSFFEYVHNINEPILSVIDKHFTALAQNWYKNLQRYNRASNAIIFSIDDESQQFLEHNDIKTFRLINNISYTNESFWPKIELFSKLTIMNYINQLEKTFFFFDVDIHLLKDPLDYIKKKCIDKDFVISSDRYFSTYNTEWSDNRQYYQRDGTTNIGDREGTLNGGILYVKLDSNTSAAAKKFLEGAFKATEPLRTDYPTVERKPWETQFYTCQHHMFEQINNNKFLKYSRLSCLLFANGSAWGIPYLKDKILKDGYTIHYNYFYDTADEKISALKKDGFWLL
jgi:hypothetical protein